MTVQATLRAWLEQSVRKAGWAPLGLLLLHIVIDHGFKLYDVFPNIDIPMHVIGGVAISYFIAHAYKVADKMGLLGNPGKLVYPIMVFALGSTSTIFWEFLEFSSDYFLHTHSQVGLNDTLGDMLCGMLGTIFLLLLLRRDKK